MPPTPEKRKWWEENALLSIENPTDRNFVVEDTERGNKIVAFSRWMVYLLKVHQVSGSALTVSL